MYNYYLAARNNTFMAIYTIQINVTDKEKDLVRLLADGYTVAEIAKKNSVNRRTLEMYVLLVKKKFQSSTLANLVAIFLKNKLID